VTVNCDGFVTTCPLDFDVRYPIGNVKEESLMSMWNNDRIKIYRKAHLNRDYEAIEQNGVLCSNCNCLWDPEYDLRKFKDFSIQAIYRAAVHFASQLKQPEATAVDDKEKYENLLLEMQKLEDRR
jgi:radical SAM protein with 4Fe4S-binding SPASM domain